jgi:hypothetical protein
MRKLICFSMIICTGCNPDHNADSDTSVDDTSLQACEMRSSPVESLPAATREKMILKFRNAEAVEYEQQLEFYLD